MVQWPIDPLEGLALLLQTLGWAVLVFVAALAVWALVLEIMRR